MTNCCPTCSMLATHLTALLVKDVLETGTANPTRKAMLAELETRHKKDETTR